MTPNRFNQDQSRNGHGDVPYTDPVPAPVSNATAEAEIAAGSAVDAAIVRALAHPPIIEIRSSFAADVARRAVAQPVPSPSPWTGWGPSIAAASGVALTLLMFAFAPHAAPSLGNARFDAEIVLFAELGTIALFSNRLLSRD